jgi:chromosome segregation ATPase
MRNEVLESQISEIVGRARSIDNLINEKIAAVATTEARLGKAKGRLSELTAEKEEAEAAQDRAVVTGGDPSIPRKRLKFVEEEQELRKVEIAALSSHLEQLVAEEGNLKKERLVVARLIPTVKLQDVGRRYNAWGEKGKPILEEMLGLQKELGEPPEGRVLQFPCGCVGALESVPRCFIPGDKGFEDAGDPEKYYFFGCSRKKEKRG